jgi:hypothetical protein
MLNYSDALIALGHTTGWVVCENDVIWLEEPTKKPTKKELDIKLKELQSVEVHE